MNKRALTALSGLPSIRRAGGVAVAAASMIGVAIAFAAPASAEVVRFSFDDEPGTHVLQPCGAVLTSSGTHSVQIVFNGNDEFVRWVEQDLYSGTIEYQGETFRATDRQVHIRYIDRDDVPIGVLNGQGIFQVVPGVGVAIYDVGHLVFNDDTGATLLESDKIISFEEPSDWDGDVCAALESR